MCISIALFFKYYCGHVGKTNQNRCQYILKIDKKKNTKAEINLIYFKQNLVNKKIRSNFYQNSQLFFLSIFKMDRNETYQIKSTPFMRRMVSTNTKNGELQRLKQEYERIKNLNEHMIEKQIKQARLRRLSHVIEIIKQTQPEREHNRTKTQQNLRLERIKIARQKGLEYSRENSMKMEQHPTNHTLLHSKSETTKFRFEPHNSKEEAERRKRSNRRLSYGNSISQQNREKIANGSSRRLTSNESAEQLDGSEEKRKLLLKRINQGNAYSTKNLLLWQNMKNTKKEHQRQMEKSNWLESINETHASDWTSFAAMPAATDQVDNGVMTKTVESLESMEDQEFMSADALPSLVQEHTITSESVVQAESLEVEKVTASTNVDSTLQQVRRLVLGALKSPFPVSKSKSTSDYISEQSDIETIQQLATSSKERLQMEDVEQQNELRQVSNSTNLQNFYEQIEIQDLGSSSSDYKCAEGSVEEHITPDELVLSCQDYMDNLNEFEKSTVRKSSALRPFEKTIDLHSKILDPIPTEDMDKEELLKLRKVQDLRSVFET